MNSTKVYFPTEIKCWKDGLKAIYEISAKDNSDSLWDSFDHPGKFRKRHYGTLYCLNPACDVTRAKTHHKETYCSIACRNIIVRQKKREKYKLK